MWNPINPASVLVDLHGQGSRTISNVVESTTLALTPMELAHNDAWSDKLAGESPDSGQVTTLGPVDAPMVPPDAVAQLQSWLGAQGIASNGSAPTALACRGAVHHHDAEGYPAQGFCVLWLSDDTQWDLVFPFLGKRLPLTYGTVVLFDSAQPHAVLRRDAQHFDYEHFHDEPLGVFLSQDFPLGSAARKRLGIRKLSRHGQAGYTLLRSGLVREDLDEERGAWHAEHLKTRQPH